MSLQAHLSELSAKHQALETQIEEAMLHPSVDDLLIAELKRKKLRIKDEMTKIEAELGTH